MQEFTISTDPSQAGNDHTEQAKYTDDARGIASQDGLASPSFEGQVDQPQGVSEKGSIKSCLTIALVVLCLVFATTSIVLGYLYLQSKEQKEEEENEVMGTQIYQVSKDYLKIKEVVPPEVQNKIFYTDSANIFVADKDGSNQIQLTNFGTSEGIVEELELIDGQNLGFFKCQISGSDFGCKIYSVNIDTKDITTKKELDSSVSLLQLTWRNKDEYAYVLKFPKEHKLIGKYLGRGQDIQLFEKDVYESTRDLFVEDDSQLRFSTNGERLYHIYTRGKSGFDFTIYVYDLAGNLNHEIPNATNPCWKDANAIIYRNYSNENPGKLYTRVLADQKASRIEKTFESAYNPEFLANKVLYWEARGLGRSYTYDFSEKNNKLLMSDSAFPVWLSEYEVIYAKTRECREAECDIAGTTEYEVQFVVEAFYVRNLESSEEFRIDLSSDTLQRGIVTWYHKHI